ncbi:MAG: TetR/AcrR family transcriptional regulator [Bacteroidia bacterium]
MTELDVRTRIVMTTTKMVKKYGIRNVSMDDVAKEVGISKRTLYQFFADKAALLLATVETHQKEEETTIKTLMNTSSNALEAYLKVIQYVSGLLKEVSPLLLFELRKYYPQIWQEMRKSEDAIQIPAIMENLNRGIEEGIFRKDIHVEIVARLRMGMMEISVNEELYPAEKFDFKTLQMEFSLFFLYGLLTEKGHLLLKDLTSTWFVAKNL